MNVEPVMPGAWICDKCGFTLQKNTLHIFDGGISADVADHCEPCPNDGNVMRALTWREANKALYEMVRTTMTELQQLRSSAKELTLALEDAISIYGGKPEVAVTEEEIEERVEAWRTVLEANRR